MDGGINWISGSWKDCWKAGSWHLPPIPPTPLGHGIYVAYPSCSVIDLSRFPQDNIGKSNV